MTSLQTVTNLLILANTGLVTMEPHFNGYCISYDIQYTCIYMYMYMYMYTTYHVGVENHLGCHGSYDQILKEVEEIDLVQEEGVGCIEKGRG